MSLTNDQQVIFDRFLQGESIFITGPAGCGKSFLLHHIKRHCDMCMIPYGITALTGAAASLIGGQTLHGWGGLGLAKEPAAKIVKNLSYRPAQYKRWKESCVLIIDEISMMSAELFNKIHLIAQTIRRNNTDLFGGIQVVLCGDFAQLDPIGSDKFCFESTVWKQHIDQNTFYLDKIIRQREPRFQALLTNLRMGIVTKEDKELLNSRLITDESEAEITVQGLDQEQVIKATVLFPKKKDVKRINDSELQKLIDSGAQKKDYAAEDTGYHKKTRNGISITKTHTDNLSKCTNACERLTLTIGAQVMLIKNKSLEEGLVNGSRGVVIGYDGVGYPVVVFDNGIKMTVAPESFEVEAGANILVRRQIPLVLAWALTVHKCQGATLTNVITDLSEAFGYAQVYVTLSRVRSLEDLFIVSLNYNRIRCNPKVKRYYESLKEKMKSTVEQ